MADTGLILGIISHERIAASMAGPGIRCWEFARALASAAEVRLFTPAHSDLEPDGFELIAYSGDSGGDSGGDLISLARGCDVLLAQGFTFNSNPGLTRMGKFLIVDLYVPMTLEAMGQYEHAPLPEQSAVQAGIVQALRRQLDIGHFFICASERQRDYWLGWLSMAGRVTPEEYARDRTLHQLIGVVPFGLPGTPPAAGGAALKGVHPAVKGGDRVLLWGGGIYNWLDPFTPIRAVARLAKQRDDVKLFFLGARHPDPNVPRMRVYDEAVALSRELGVLDSAVIFNDTWVPYARRVEFLLEADLGVNANIEHIETRFAFRTRILDCIWASLPLVTTHGDSLSALAEKRGMGLVVESGDDEAYAVAINRLLDDEALYRNCQENLLKMAQEFTWPVVTRPIAMFLKRCAGEGGASPGITKVPTEAAPEPAAGGGLLRNSARKIKRRLK